jgi:hypothetical protein
MKHHHEAGEERRSEVARMADDVDWTVALPRVLDADRAVRAAGRPLPEARRTARVAELRRRVVEGAYTTERMMDAVARHILASGDL